MQLSGAGRAAPADPGRTLSPFTRTLLALAVITVPALGGVLPEDRFDALWHYYNGGDITVEGPEVLVRKKVGDNLSLSASYYEDMISSASIDVKLSASPYHETRKQENAGVDYLHGKTTYSVGYIHSREPDYIANTTYYSVSQDMFGDLTTLTLGYRRGWDQVFRDIKDPDGVIVNDPTFHQRADHRGYSLSLSQILTRNAILNFNYELLTRPGVPRQPLSQDPLPVARRPGASRSPIRSIPTRAPATPPRLQLKYYLPWRAALTAQYRFFRDTWGIVAHTGELDYTHAGVQALDLRRQPALLPANARRLLQRPVSACQLPELHGARPRARRLPQLHHRRRRLLSVPDAGMPWMSKNTLNVRVDHLLIDYSDFRNALLAGELRRRQRAALQAQREHLPGVRLHLVLAALRAAQYRRARRCAAARVS